MDEIVKRLMENHRLQEEVDDPVTSLLSKNLEDTVEYARALDSAVKSFKQDLNKIPSDMDGLSPEYNQDKRDIYRRYKPLADECKKTLSELSVSGYGKLDSFKVKIKELCKFVDYNFPYGWKSF